MPTYTPRNEREAHVALWRESGLSKAAYCRQANLAYHRLISWVRSTEQDKPHAAGSDAGFVAVHEMTQSWQTSSIAAAEPSVVRIVVNEQVSIEATAEIDAQWLGSLVGELASC